MHQRLKNSNIRHHALIVLTSKGETIRHNNYSCPPRHWAENIIWIYGTIYVIMLSSDIYWTPELEPNTHTHTHTQASLVHCVTFHFISFAFVYIYTHWTDWKKAHSCIHAFIHSFIHWFSRRIMSWPGALFIIHFRNKTQNFVVYPTYMYVMYIGGWAEYRKLTTPISHIHV